MNSPLPSPDLTGQTLGDYTLLRRLGRGGMADVYLAKQMSLQRNIALKILKPELAKDESYVKRFHREAQAAAALVQTNIVQIFEVGDWDGLHFIAQEYVHGRNLRQYMDRYGAVEPVMAINILKQCALALQKAAEFSVVHRDIKPENIMLSTSGEIKVTDFGLARVNNNASQQALTQIGITMGTPLYMSPEQVEGRSLDSRSDIYSLGVTAYHTLAGQPPFDGENALAIAVQQVQEKAKPLHTIRPDVPVELCQTIHRMLSKDPNGRPQDPAALLKELRKIKLDTDDDMDTLVNKLSLTVTAAASSYSPAATQSQSKLAATQQLQTLLRGHQKSWWGGARLLWSLVALSLLAMVAGMLAATWTVPEFPLEVPASVANRIPKKETIEDQYSAAYWGTYALSPSDEAKKVEYWQAVLDYFPLSDSNSNSQYTTELYHLRAKERLGEIYLANNNLPAALEIYQQLETSENYTRFEVIGYAGQAVIYDLMDPTKFTGGADEQQQKIRECISQIGSRTELLNQFMRKRIDSLRLRYPAKV